MYFFTRIMCINTTELTALSSRPFSWTTFKTLRTGNAVDLNTNSLILPLALITSSRRTFTNLHSISQSHPPAPPPLIPSLSSSISRIAPHLTQKRESFPSLSGSSLDRSLLHVSWRDRPTCIQTTETRVASPSIINA